MRWLVVLLGVVFVGSGLWGLVRPTAGIELARRTLARDHGLPLVVLVRVVIGLLLLFSAEQTRLPGLIFALGALSLAAAALLPLLGKDEITPWIDWWAELPTPILRTWLALSLAFGLVLIYAGLP